AVKLNKHRTTIGQVITNLEDLLAVSLFNRVGRSVEPTEDARLLYHYAKQTIEQARTFDKVALSLAHGGLESVSIAYSSAIPHR
ncbi:LysR family transcriptional regulator, partial [Vibrio diabolicus]